MRLQQAALSKRLIPSLVFLHMLFLVEFNDSPFSVKIQGWCCQYFSNRSEATLQRFSRGIINFWLTVWLNLVHLDEGSNYNLVAIVSRRLFTWRIVSFFAGRPESCLFNFRWTLYHRITHSFLTCWPIHWACSLRVLKPLSSWSSVIRPFILLIKLIYIIGRLNCAVVLIGKH